MSKPVPRSRLHITYRTTIDGKQKQAKLPMRFLVLGDFTGPHNRKLLGEREIYSILPGMKLESFMEALKVTAPIQDPGLKQVLNGRLEGEVTATIPDDLPDGTARVKIEGKGEVKGLFTENRLGSFAGAFEIVAEIEVPFADGKPAIPEGGHTVDLELKGKVEPLQDAKFGLTGDAERLQGAEIGITGDVSDKFSVTFTVLPDDPASTDVKGGLKLRLRVTCDKVKVHLTIPLRSISDFKPLNLAMRVPEIRRLDLLHRLVLEARNHILGFPQLRETLKDELSKLATVATADGEKMPLGKLRKYLCTKYPQLVAGSGQAADPDEDLALEDDAKALLETLIRSAGMNPEKKFKVCPLVKRQSSTEGPNATNVAFYDRELYTGAERFVNLLAVLLVNIDPFAERPMVNSIQTLMRRIDVLLVDLDKRVDDWLAKVIQSKVLRELEISWRSLDDLCRAVDANDVYIDFLDTTKGELKDDFDDHSSYILNSALFRKVYIDEYDRYGGRPIGMMVGLYEFDRSEGDVNWLRTMSHICSASHCPFVAAVSSLFFGCKSWEELDRKQDIEELMGLPEYGLWSEFRESPGAAYIGLTLPRYMLRAPYAQSTTPQSTPQLVDFEEKISSPDDYVWGSAAVLFARNMVKSFQDSGWCQHIAGPLGGGMVKGLPVHMKLQHGQKELQPPVEVAIADYRELQLATAGFIPLIHCKGTADATFFSARSVKKAIEYEDDNATKNSDLVCNLAYTLSITRIAHYVKRMVRDYIGSTADGPYIQAMLEAWLVEYVTTAVNPDDLTLRHYPFKAMKVSVEPKPGPFGWYSCKVMVLPHIQFQGMDVELRLEAALGGV